MSSWEDLLKYWLSAKETGYDVIKTLTYAIILVVAVYFIYRLLNRFKIKIDRKLVIGITPYVLFGSILRVLQDAGTVNFFLFVTPSIYVFVASIVLIALVVSFLLEKRKNIPYYKPLFAVGLILVSISIVFLRPVNFYGAALVALFFLPWAAIFTFFKKWSLANRIVTSVQMFDATTTFVALQFFGLSGTFFGFYEQHILPTFLINMFGPISFIFVKLVVIVSILLLIDKFSEEKNFSSYLKLIIGILGAATGIRDFIAIFAMIG